MYLDGAMKNPRVDQSPAIWEFLIPSLIALTLLINLNNGLYTWSNSRDSPTMTLIDRFLVTDPILTKFKEATVKCLDRPTLDHFPLWLQLGSIRWGPLPFYLRTCGWSIVLSTLWQKIGGMQSLGLNGRHMALCKAKGFQRGCQGLEQIHFRMPFIFQESTSFWCG